MSTKPMYYKNWDEMPAVLDLADCAIILKITYDTARKWAKKGKLPATQIGGTEWRVEKTALKKMFEGGVA